jgi:trk system potassium uptake protein TrkA
VHIVIMGCGRTGASLAEEFEARGHSVAVIDRTGDAFRRLPSSFQGQKITGIGFDRETLVSAGVEEAYGFAAVSDGDNSNILAARVVRETYGVENVVARISDSGRADVYRRLGIPTVAPVPWTSSQIVSRLLPGVTDAAYVDAEAGVALRRIAPHHSWVGHPLTDIEAASACRVAYVVRFGEATLPVPGSLLQSGDEVYFVVPEPIAKDAERALARPRTVKA